MEYRREIDGLRSLAVIPVIFFHAGIDAFRGGFVGVDVFFVISGYLITTLILQEKREGRFSIANFYERRVRRILPVLTFVMLCCLPFALWLMLPGQLISFSNSVISVALFISNFLFWTESGYFRDASEVKPLLHTWSLAVEEQYYLLFPLLLIVAWRLGTRRLVYLILATAIASLALSEIGARRFPVANFFLAPTRAWELFAGALCAFYLANPEKKRRSSAVLSLVGLVMIAVSVHTYSESTLFPSMLALLPVLGTVMVILFSRGTPVASALSTPLLVWIGLLSYSAYLWHQPIFAFVRLHNGENPSTLIALGLIAAVFGLSYLSWRFIEMPFRSRSRTNLRQVLLFVGGLTAINVAYAVVSIRQDGFVSRYRPEDRSLVAMGAKDAGWYIANRFERLAVNEFDPTKSVKVLIIGDSFAQDFVNLLHEGGLDENASIVTHYIATGCGNLMLDWDFTDRIPSPEKRAQCTGDPGYKSPELVRLLREADMVWIASSWTPWEAGLIAESVANVRRATAGKVFVVGSKHFGPINVRSLLAIPPKDRPALRNPVPPKHLETNARMKAALDAETFVDLQALMCGAAADCAIFNERIEILTHDGRHFTEAGAKLAGTKLALDLRLRPLLVAGAAKI